MVAFSMKNEYEFGFLKTVRKAQLFHHKGFAVKPKLYSKYEKSNTVFTLVILEQHPLYSCSTLLSVVLVAFSFKNKYGFGFIANLSKA